jgi:hypothetical protein
MPKNQIRKPLPTRDQKQNLLNGPLDQVMTNLTRQSGMNPKQAASRVAELKISPRRDLATGR